MNRKAFDEYEELANLYSGNCSWKFHRGTWKIKLPILPQYFSSRALRNYDDTLIRDRRNS